MTVMLHKLPVLVLLVFQLAAAQAEPQPRWGRASLEDIDYAPHKVVYDVAAADIEQFNH